MKPFFVDQIKIDPPVVLAPMEGVTDLAFRSVIRSLGGCGLTVTEFVSSEGMTREVETAWRMAELDPQERPVSIQIYGRDPERMAEAAKHCQNLGADIIDINLGCPAKRVVSGCAGSALMKEPEIASEIFQAVNEAITIPMTVKMRLGWDHAHLNAPEIAARAVAQGAKMITVHGRTRSDLYKGHARWELIRHVKDAVDVPVLVNGDIVDPQSAFLALEQSGADGVMVGRGVMKDPWTIKQIACAFREEAFVEPTLIEKRDVLHAYLNRVDDGQALSTRTLLRLKQVAGYFSKGLYNATEFRKCVHNSRSYDEVRSLINAYFDELMAFEANKLSA